MKVIVSGVQPTGNLHLGNYLGSVARWKRYEEEYKCFFPIVDLHAITAELPDPKEFKKTIYTTLATYLASGLDPKKVVLFKQSDVPQHSELFWILSCFTQIGKLSRMTQFKDKSGKNKEKSSLGLYAYPILMAADILLYNANAVPVGDDQLQHIELANDIAGSINHKYNHKIFKEIEPLVAKRTKRIMSLRDGTSKMSKSDSSDMSRINLTDDADLIRKKISKSKTDAYEDLITDIDNRPEVKNLLNIFSVTTNKDVAEIQKEYNGKGFKIFKEDLAEAIIAKIEPVGSLIEEYLKDLTYLDSVFASGSAKAIETAEANLSKVKDLIGF